MPIKVEGPRNAEFIQSEANGYRSRDEVIVTVPANTTIQPGRIMGKITATGKFVPQVAAGTDNGTREPAAILYAAVTNATASPADVKGVVVQRDAEVKAKDIIYDPAANGAAVIAANAALAEFGIIVRE